MKKILMIEDDTALYKLYSTELRMRGYETISITNGQEGVDAIRREKPDLVLLDLMLPGRNGLEILQDIQESDDLSGTRIIMLTNYGDDTNVKRALSLGAIDYILKYNVVPSELSGKVAHVLGDSNDSVVTLTNV